MMASAISARLQSGKAEENDESTVKFGDYIDRATKKAAIQMGLDRHRQDRTQPLLKEGQVNRILVYAGAFNPPHRGHMRVLQHGFHECGHNFNAVAAVVLVTSNDCVSRKNKKSSRHLLLDVSERQQLWISDEESPDWAWIMPYDDWLRDEVVNGQLRRVDVGKKIMELANADGFIVDCVSLCGPDNFQNKSMIRSRHLISTAARAPTRYSNSDGPAKLSNCTEWLDYTTQAQPNTIQAQNVRLPLWLPLENETRVWHCTSYDHEGAWARYLYCPLLSKDLQNQELISSTSIHRAIATLDEELLLQFFRKFVLSPATLSIMLRSTGSTPLKNTTKTERENLSAQSSAAVIVTEAGQEELAKPGSTRWNTKMAQEAFDRMVAECEGQGQWL